MSMTSKVLLLCKDLFFTSRIQETARQVGAEVNTLRGGLGAAVQKEAPTLILVDLDAEQLRPIEEIRDARKEDGSLPIVAFVRHEHIELIRAAREAGASQVLARGAFSTKLPELLRSKDAG